MKNHLVIAAVVLIFTAPFYCPLHAQEFAYVTDSLQLRVYSSASASSEVLQSIDSGDSVEVFVTENGFSKVTTYDGTVGWVKSAFLVADPPAKLLYYSVGEQNKQLEAEIEALKNNLQSKNEVSSNAADTNLINELKAQLEQQQQSNQVLRQQLDESGLKTESTLDGKAESQLKTLSVSAAGSKPELPIKNMKWLFTGSAALLLLGLIFGVKLSTWRMRKRLHGFSI